MMRLLYIARAYPPTLGGMERLACQLNEGMRRYADVVSLINFRGKKALPAFLPYALVAAVRLARKHRAEAVLLGDALLAPLGRVLKRATGLPVASSVCGLDVTYANRLYQSVVPPSLAGLDMAIAISKATEAEVKARAGGGTPTTVIPLGVNPLPPPGDGALREFRARAGVNGGPLVLTAGRLIKRKGVSWFVDSVVPGLGDETTYVVIGEGEEDAAIRSAAAGAGVAERVRLLGRVPDEVLAAAYRAADVFVMPNVRVPGDMEGFGLVALEAAASGLPVVASKLEGINEAVHHERNGVLVTPGAADEYLETLGRLLALPPPQRRAVGDAFRAYTMETYSWERASQRYVETMKEVAAKAR